MRKIWIDHIHKNLECTKVQFSLNFQYSCLKCSNYSLYSSWSCYPTMRVNIKIRDAPTPQPQEILLEQMKKYKDKEFFRTDTVSYVKL